MSYDIRQQRERQEVMIDRKDMRGKKRGWR
jgi:hypothetical protein